MKRNVIIVPIYKETPSEFERVAFTQGCKILGKHDFAIVSHNKLDLSQYESILNANKVTYKIELFDLLFFKSEKTYSKLLLEESFYGRFEDYSFMLIYQLDAYVFADDLDYWCKQNYDYIGAPWFENYNLSTSNSKMLKNAGNGGFSLRRIKSCIRVLRNEKIQQILHDDFLPTGKNEDGFFSMIASSVDQDFRVGPPKNASKFSFECQPRRLYEMNGKKLPFGCHAWEQYDFNFWKQFIDLKEVGFQIKSEATRKEPLVTIVTVTYNLVESGREDYFKQCIESVHDQAYETVEHIVIDGGSKDGSIDLIREYADKDWITYVSEPDNGIYDAMNKGISMANGECIAFLNSDDYYLHDDVISLCVKGLLDDNADFSYGDCEMINGKKSILFSGKIEEFLCHMPVPHPSMFTKTDILRKEGGFNEKYGLPADYELLIRLVLKNYKSIYIKNRLVGFRTDGATQGADYSDDMAQIFVDHYSKFYTFFNSQVAKDLHYKKEIPFKFTESFREYATSAQLNNIDIDKVVNYLSEQNIHLSMMEKKISKKIYKKNVETIVRHGKKQMNPKVSVIIVAWNERDDLIRNIEHFQNQTEKEFEVIIIDNGLDQDIKKRISEYSLMHIILSSNVGLSAGRNIGACFANADLLAFIDGDGYVNKCYIESVLEIFKDKSKIIVRGKVLPINCSTTMPPVHYDYGNEQTVSFMNTEGNSVMRTKDYLKVGGQEDSLFGHEGSVMCFRMLEYFGYERKNFYYDPRLVLHHDFEKPGDGNKNKDMRHEMHYRQIINFYPNFVERLKEFTVSTDDSVELQKKNEEIDILLNENVNLKESKSFRIGNLLFRSMKDPYKLILFPVNFLKILIK